MLHKKLLEASPDVFPELATTHPKKHFVSIYMPVSSDDSITTIKLRLHALLAQAENLLAESMPINQAKVFTLAIREDIAKISPDKLKQGLAILVSERESFVRHLDHDPPELCVVADSYHIKPLLHSTALDLTCFAILVTHNQLSLYRCTREHIQQIEIYRNQESDLKKVKDTRFTGQKKRSKELTDRLMKQYVKHMHRDFDLQHKNIAIFGPRLKRLRLEQALESINGLSVFHSSEIYSSLEEIKQTTISKLTDRIIDHTTSYIEDLKDKQAWGTVTDSLEEIAAAAVQGRIDKLIVDASTQIWGHFDREYGRVSTHAEQRDAHDDCVIDDIIQEVVKHKGRIIFVDSKVHQPIPPYLAVFRW